MFEDMDFEEEQSKPRRDKKPLARTTAPRVANTARHVKKSAAPGYGGVHRRRNKRWDW